jgi:hypothetical protein
MGPAVVVAAGVVIALGNLSLLLICWKRRTALAGLLGAVGVALGVPAIARFPSRGTGWLALLAAVGTLLFGSVLYALGQLFERLLDDGRDDATRDEAVCRGRDET